MKTESIEAKDDQIIFVYDINGQLFGVVINFNVVGNVYKTSITDYVAYDGNVNGIVTFKLNIEYGGGLFRPRKHYTACYKTIINELDKSYKIYIDGILSSTHSLQTYI